MAIPNHEQIQYEILKLLTDNVARRKADLVDPLAKIFGLSDDDLSKEYDSGNGLIFVDRISWALSYLNISGVVTRPKRGLYQITTLGHELSKDPVKFKEHVKRKYKEREILQKTTESNLETSTLAGEERTPEENLYSSYEEIKSSVYQEILDTILSKTPREFEKLVVTLLQKMGYGGEITDSGVVTSYSNDKGIDGIIKEDILGFGTICIQAKRNTFDNSVKRDAVQKFVGAVMQAQSAKGVFITTSEFTKGALEFAQQLPSNMKIILVDGKRLASYIYEFNLGMQTEQFIEIKKLDGDFWDNLQDENN